MRAVDNEKILVFVDIPSGGFQRDSGAILCEQPELQGRVLNVVCQSLIAVPDRRPRAPRSSVADT